MRPKPIRELSKSVIESLYNAEFRWGKEMEYLPITSCGKRVYAGFWKRFCAAWVDFFIIVPLALLCSWLEGFDRTLAIVIAIPSSALFAMYNVYFNACFGGTLGKLAVGIKITNTDGSRIGWGQAWKRSSVDLVFAFLLLTAEIWALAHVDPVEHSSLEWMDRARLLQEHRPVWSGIIDVLMQVWIWSELVVLLFNKRKRAIHDFIAGTVVIKKEFAEQGGAVDTDEARN